MPSECILDAHSLIWFIEGNSKLGTHAQQLLADPAVRLIVPAIALAEACRVTEKGRTTIPSVAALFALIDGDARLSVAPVDRDIVWRSTDLTAISEMHDRLIVATALQQHHYTQSAVLLTADARIRTSGLVPTLW